MQGSGCRWSEHAVKLGQAAQAKEEACEAGQHLQLLILLIPTLSMKSAGRGGKGAVRAQGAHASMPFPCLPLCSALPHCVTDASGPNPLFHLYFRLWVSPWVRSAPAVLSHPVKLYCSQGTAAADVLQRVSCRKEGMFGVMSLSITWLKMIGRFPSAIGHKLLKTSLPQILTSQVVNT